MNKHTPGPWIIHPRIKDAVITSKGGSIADLVGTKPGGEHEANARLIAAAPELLNECKRILSAIQSGAWTLKNEDGENPCLYELEKAIAKATVDSE